MSAVQDHKIDHALPLSSTLGEPKMPEINIDLHGSAPHKHRFALLLIDVINDFDFPEADQLLKHARPMARIILRLKQRAQKAGVR